MKNQITAIRETIIAGKTILTSLKISSGNHKEKRSKRSNITSDKVRKNNDRLAAKMLTAILNINFKPGDIHLTLTYAGLAPSQEQAKKDRAKFIRQLRRFYPGIKYVAVTEFEHKKIHHHIVLSNCDVEIIKSLWEDKGFQNIKLLDSTGNYIKLAEYLIKETSKTFREEGACYKRRYSCSSNIERPVIKRDEIAISEIFEDPEPVKGYYIPKDYVRRFEHPITGMNHLEYIQVALDEPWHMKKWPRGKVVSGKERFKVNYIEEQEELQFEVPF